MRLHISKYSSSTHPVCSADISFSSSLAAVTSVSTYVLFISVPYLKMDFCRVLQAGLLFLPFRKQRPTADWFPAWRKTTVDVNAGDNFSTPKGLEYWRKPALTFGTKFLSQRAISSQNLLTDVFTSSIFILIRLSLRFVRAIHISDIANAFLWESCY